MALGSALLRRLVPLGPDLDANALGSLLVAGDVSAATFDGSTLVTPGDVAAAISAFAGTLAAIATTGSASDLGTGTLPIARVADGAVLLAKLADLAQATIIGRAAAAGTGVPVALSAADLSAILGLAAVATSGSASDLGAGTLPIARIADAAVTLAKLANLNAGELIGRKTTGAGVPEAISLGWFSPVIDFKTTGTTIVIPPCPFRLDAARMDYVPTSIAACSVGPTVSLGSNSASFNNWQTGGAISGFTSTGAFGRIAATATATNVIDLTTSGFVCNVTGGATATTCQGRVVISGALMPV